MVPDADELARVVERAVGEDVAARIRFVAELDALRTVVRRSYIAGGARLENSGEHSWHVATMALALAPLLGPVDVAHVVAMLLVHDVVEIDAGDVSVYDYAARAEKAHSERIAAERVFGLLPEPTSSTLRALWEEYEERSTAEARAAAALDHLAPLLLNWLAGGRTWQEVGVTEEMARAVNEPVVAATDDRLLAVVCAVLDDARDRRWFVTASPDNAEPV